MYNPNDPNVAPEIERIRTVGTTLGVQLRFLEASNEGDINTAFVEMTRRKADALLMFTDAFLNGRVDQVVGPDWPSCHSDDVRLSGVHSSRRSDELRH